MTGRGRVARLTGLLALGALLGCRSGTQAPEPGALLLRIDLAAGAPVPDELRLSAYDDTGVLWTSARFPTEGPLVPQSASVLGTILLQPGTTVGALRIDLRGLRAGALVDEGLLSVAPDERGAELDLPVSAALPSDGDRDGVPDPIDDCPATPDPAQAGCAADAGAPGKDAGAPRDAGAPGKDAAAPPADLPPGAACGSPGQCHSGFCKDGACCNSACTDPCNSCATGTCTPVTSGEDAPECAAPMSCNKKSKCVAN